MKTHLILLAGGTGSRFGSPLPKQFLPLGGAPLFHKGLHTLVQIPSLDQIVIVIDPEFASYLPTGASGAPGAYLTASPGATRMGSVKSGFAQISAEPGDLILIHDGARPHINRKDVERLLAASAEVGAAVLGCPVVHTLKRVQNKRVLETVPRDELWEVYTPQCIEASLLTEALQLDIPATDDVSLVEALGRPVAMVRAEKAIPKVTYKEDYEALNV